MASPTFKGDAAQRPFFKPHRFGLGRVPLAIRRGAAWTIEISLVVVSALAPFEIGLQAKAAYPDEQVPLNPVLATVETAIAKTLAIPIGDDNHRVAPLTNLFWSLALLAPVAVAGTQLYLLAKTGSTPSKRWLGIRVTTETGHPPGWSRTLVREGGRWGVPLGIAYLIWRYSGAFPGLNILAGLAGLMVLGEGLSAQIHTHRRAFHDRGAGTWVHDTTAMWWTYAGTEPQTYTFRIAEPVPVDVAANWADDSEDGAIAAVILGPETVWPRSSLWRWMRQRPGTTLMLLLTSTAVLVVGTVAGTQIYIQSQANWRESQQQKNQVYLTLVDKLTPASNNPAEERRATILALGTIDDPRAVYLLVDLLAQENDPVLMEAIHQALVSIGPEALSRLQILNQSLRTELASVRRGANEAAQTAVALRQRATQRAIAKILTTYSRDTTEIDLNRIDLGRTSSGPAQFTLVLDQADLSGVQFRGALLTQASLRKTRFYGAGPDDRWGTFDDRIADLSGAELTQAELTEADLRYGILNRTSLIDATLDKANLAYAQLLGANLSSATLISANLQQAVLEDASFTGANLGEANFSQANLSRARLGQVEAADAQFPSANLSQTDWRGANLARADFSNANLKDADFSNARLTGADLSGAHLQNASLRNVDLSAVNLRNARLEGADFRGASFYHARASSRTDAFIRPLSAIEDTGFLRGVDFSQVRNLDAEQVAYICAQGGIVSGCLE